MAQDLCCGTRSLHEAKEWHAEQVQVYRIWTCQGGGPLVRSVQLLRQGKAGKPALQLLLLQELVPAH